MSGGVDALHIDLPEPDQRRLFGALQQMRQEDLTLEGINGARSLYGVSLSRVNSAGEMVATVNYRDADGNAVDHRVKVSHAELVIQLPWLREYVQ